ncbi:MAG: 50S ribosomal protein L25 [Caldilineaceae bacterium]|nr:50S ribosomal protein L25 [Caldilineaceae bacterium]
MSDLKLEAQPRMLVGRKVRQLRRQGLVPVTVYGKKQVAESLQVSERSFERVLQAAGFSQLVQIDIAGGATRNVLIREVQRHPVTHSFLHIDFYAVDLTEKQHVQVPVHSVGKPETLAQGLMVLQALDHVTVEALPRDIPTHIEVSITKLTLEEPITVADLPVIEGVAYVNEAEESVFTLIVTRAAVEAEGAEGTPTGAEPELVRTRRDEDEE